MKTKESDRSKSAQELIEYLKEEPPIFEYRDEITRRLEEYDEMLYVIMDSIHTERAQEFKKWFKSGK